MAYRLNRMTKIGFGLVAALAPAVAGAQPSKPTTVAGTKGQCEEVELAGQISKCKPDSGIIYMQLPNGNVLFTFALDDGRMASFVGEKDSQPRPEEYHLYLSRIRIVSTGSDFVAKIAGQCIVQMSRDGKIWSRIDCTATDENSAAYRLTFKGDGNFVDVQHAGAGGHVEPAVVAQVTARFKGALQAGGIHAVVADLGKCFDGSLGNIPAIKACMLYDISAVRFDKAMRKIFESRGKNAGPAPPFLLDRAFNTRMQIYSGMAFAGSEKTAYEFFGGAPNDVMNGLSK